MTMSRQQRTMRTGRVPRIFLFLPVINMRRRHTMRMSHTRPECVLISTVGTKGKEEKTVSPLISATRCRRSMTLPAIATVTETIKSSHKRFRRPGSGYSTAERTQREKIRIPVQEAMEMSSTQRGMQWIMLSTDSQSPFSLDLESVVARGPVSVPCYNAPVNYVFTGRQCGHADLEKS